MTFIDCQIDKGNNSLILIDSKGKEKKLRRHDVKSVYVLDERKTAPIKWYHILLMRIFLIIFSIIVVVKTLALLDSGALDPHPIIKQIIFSVTLIYTILAILIFGFSITLNFSGEGKFIAFYLLKLLMTRKKKYFVIKTARKEYKILLRSKKQKNIFQEKALDVNNLFNQ